MRYNDKLLIKLYKFENNSFILKAIIDDYETCSWERNVFQAGQFSIQINYNIPNSNLFEKNLFVQFGDYEDDFGVITDISDSISSDGKSNQIRSITGFDCRYLFKRRIIKNLNNNETWNYIGAGELCIRKLIQDQCGTNAEEKRQLPIENIVPETGLGKTYTVSESYSNLLDVLETIAIQSEIGWGIKFINNKLILHFFTGNDLSDSVNFSTNFESLSDGEFVDSSKNFCNAIYIGGKGNGSERDIYLGESEELPSGLDRFEAWDNQSSMTTIEEYKNEANSMLSQYNQTISLSGNGLAKSPYIYRENYNVGDIITVSFSNKTAKTQILSVTENWQWNNYSISFEFGKPIMDLSKQLKTILNQIQIASTKSDSTNSVKYYNIPTDSEMPSGDVTYDTIGFKGDVGTGSTFKLFFNSEKVGSKTYHIYFKQLQGNGKLTLTTGVSDKTNLEFSPGTYVAIVYVDDDGNLKSGSSINDSVTSSTTSWSSQETKSQITTTVSSSMKTKNDKITITDETASGTFTDGTAIILNPNQLSGPTSFKKRKTSALWDYIVSKLKGTKESLTSDFVDGSSLVGFSGTSGIPFYNRTALNMWNYIKNKISSDSKEIRNKLLGTVNSVTTSIDDNTQFMFHYVSPTDENGAVYTRSGNYIWNYINNKCDSIFLQKNNSFTKSFRNSSFNIWRMIILGKCPVPNSTTTGWGSGWHIDGTMMWSRPQGHNSNVIRFHATAGYSWNCYTGGGLDYEYMQTTNSLSNIAIGTTEIDDEYYVVIKFYQSMALEYVDILGNLRNWSGTDDKFLTCVDRTDDNASWFDDFVEFPDGHRWNRVITSPVKFLNGLSGNITGTASNATNDKNGNDITTTYATKSEIPKLTTLTQSEYDALTTKDSDTYYFIKE